MSCTKFIHVTISVEDLNESLNFYQDVIGLKVKRRFSAGGSDIVFLGDGGTEIELIFNPAKPNNSIGQDISLGFEVPSLKEAASRLKEMGVETSKVIQPNPHVMFFFFSDPNGVRIQFVENVK